MFLLKRIEFVFRKVFIFNKLCRKTHENIDLWTKTVCFSYFFNNNWITLEISDYPEISVQ
jgi:hypothetical protein